MKQSIFAIAGAIHWTVARWGKQGPEFRNVPRDKHAANGEPPLSALAVEWGLNGARAFLGLPGEMIMAVPVDCSQLPRTNRRETLLYRFEEQVPLDVESLTVDFLPTVHGRTLGVAVLTADAMSAIEELEACGISVGYACPVALMALWQSLRNPASEADYIIVATPPRVDVFRCHGGIPVNWLMSTCESDALARVIEADLLLNPSLQSCIRIAVCGLLNSDMLAERIPADVTSLGQEEPLAAATSAAAGVLSGKKPWIDLRRDGLEPRNAFSLWAKSIRRMAVTSMIVLALATGLLLLQAARYDALASDHESRQAALYAGAYPGTSVPIDVRSRLASEAGRLEGVVGASGAPSQPNCLQSLRLVIGSLPPDMKVQVNEVRISPSAVMIEGCVLNHTDAAAIAKALSSAGLPCDTPRTQQMPKGEVAFTINLRLDASPAGAMR